MPALVVHDDLFERVPVGLTREEFITAEEFARDADLIFRWRLKTGEHVPRQTVGTVSAARRRFTASKQIGRRVGRCVQVPRHSRLAQVETACRPESLRVHHLSLKVLLPGTLAGEGCGAALEEVTRREPAVPRRAQVQCHILGARCQYGRDVD